MSHQIERRRGFHPLEALSHWLDEGTFRSLGFQDEKGVTLSEDDSKVYVEVALPGLQPEEVDISHDHLLLWIKGEHQEEEQDKDRKYYCKASSSFSYHVRLPDSIDENTEPEATFKNGLMRVTFDKKKQGTPKKIPIKS